VPDHDAYHPDPASAELHSTIYVALAGLCVWLIASAWVFFGSQGQYAGYAVAVATGFFLVAGAIPFVIWRVWRHSTPPGPSGQRRTTFSDWRHGQMETWEGQVSGRDAAIEVLLPLGAAAIGMTLIGLAFWLTAG